MLHSKVYALVVIVLNRKSCQIHNKKHSTSLDDHNWRLEEVKTEERSSLKKKLQGDLKYCADFTSFRTEIIDKGSARKVNVEQLAPQKKEKSAT